MKVTKALVFSCCTCIYIPKTTVPFEYTLALYPGLFTPVIVTCSSVLEAVKRPGYKARHTFMGWSRWPIPFGFWHPLKILDQARFHRL